MAINTNQYFVRSILSMSDYSNFNSVSTETATGNFSVRQHLIAFVPMAHVASTATNLRTCVHACCLLMGMRVGRIVSAVSDGAGNVRKVDFACFHVPSGTTSMYSCASCCALCRSGASHTRPTWCRAPVSHSFLLCSRCPPLVNSCRVHCSRAGYDMHNMTSTLPYDDYKLCAD